MDYEKDLKKILCRCQSESKTLDDVKTLTAKQNILDVLENSALGVSIESLGITLEDLDNIEYMQDIEQEDLDIFEFQKKPKKKKKRRKKVPKNVKPKKTDKYIVNLYRYVAHPSSGYGSSNIGGNTRSFCRKVVGRTNTSLMRYVDILKLNGSNKGFGQGGSNIYSVFKFRGGVNCKHIWVKYSYNKNTRQLIKAPKNKQPKMIDAGKVGNA